jgi:hypothetical protein
VENSPAGRVVVAVVADIVIGALGYLAFTSDLDGVLKALSLLLCLIAVSGVSIPGKTKP